MKKKKITAKLKKPVEKNNSAANCNNKSTLNYNIETREKRINIIFKVIYVNAAILISLILNIQQGISTKNIIIFSGLFSFLFWIFFYLLNYIFNELQCLKIDEKSIGEKQIKKAEDSYTFIFKYFNIGIFTHLILIILTGLIADYLKNQYILFIIIISVVLASSIGNIGKNKKVTKVISSVLWSICTFFSLYMIALDSAI